MNQRKYNLPDWVVCPLCHGRLERVDLEEDIRQIGCLDCSMAFPVANGIPELLDSVGRTGAVAVTGEETEGYHVARHATPCNIQYYDFWCEDLLGRLPSRDYPRVVELMAGGAELSRRACALPRPIVAIDLNRDLLARSRDELVPDIVPVCASALRLPFRDGSLDLVLIQGGLHHVRRMVGPVVKEIARCMAPGAMLLASEPRNDNALNRVFRRAFYRLHPIPDEKEEDGFTESELREFLSNAGLALEQYDPFAYLGYMLIGNTDLVPFFARMKSTWASSLLIGLDRRWGRVPLARGLGWASQILARKPSTTSDPTARVAAPR